MPTNKNQTAHEQSEQSDFEEFWPQYLEAHRHPVNRALHYVGTVSAIALITGGVLTLNPVVVLSAIPIGYGPAWVGHFFFERNRPATFEHPLWSLRADLRMLGQAISVSSRRLSASHVSGTGSSQRSSRTGRTGRTVAVLVAPTAVLVTALLLALRLHFQPPNVPAYTLVSDAGEVIVIRPGARFELEATPALEVQGAVTARGFLVPVAAARADRAAAESAAGGTDAGDDLRPWRVPMEVGRDGSVHVAGPVDVLFVGVPAGEWDVTLAVGRPEMLPNDPRELLRLNVPAAGRDGAPARGHARDADAAAWRIVRQRVRLEK